MNVPNAPLSPSAAAPPNLKHAQGLESALMGTNRSASDLRRDPEYRCMIEMLWKSLEAKRVRFYAASILDPR